MQFIRRAIASMLIGGFAWALSCGFCLLVSEGLHAIRSIVDGARTSALELSIGLLRLVLAIGLLPTLVHFTSRLVLWFATRSVAVGQTLPGVLPPRVIGSIKSEGGAPLSRCAVGVNSVVVPIRGWCALKRGVATTRKGDWRRIYLWRPFSSPVARILNACYLLEGLKQSKSEQTLELISMPNTTFILVRVNAGQQIYVNPQHVVGFIGAERASGAPATHVGGLLHRYWWCLGHPLPMFVRGECDVLLQARSWQEIKRGDVVPLEQVVTMPAHRGMLPSLTMNSPSLDLINLFAVWTSYQALAEFASSTSTFVRGHRDAGTPIGTFSFGIAHVWKHYLMAFAVFVLIHVLRRSMAS